MFYLDWEHECLPCTAFGRSGHAQDRSHGATQTSADPEMSPLTYRFGDAISQMQMSKGWHSFKNQPPAFVDWMKYLWMCLEAGQVPYSSL